MRPRVEMSLRRAIFLAFLAASVLFPLFTAQATNGRPPKSTPVSVPVPAPQLPTWTPPFWSPTTSAAVVHKAVCFSPDIAPINRIECWPIDASGYPYGPYYVPAVN